jgi:RNA polymerase sigma factor (sigma-70 family)
VPRLPRLDRRTDAQLLVTTAHDAQAFACFYRRHAAGVLRFFRRHVAEPELAADLMAETFAAALVAARRYRPSDAPAEAWLYAIARHKLIDAVRKGATQDGARKRLAIGRIDLRDDDIQRVEEIAGPDATGQLALRRLANLSDDQRRAITARIIEERTYRDIAAEMNCSEAAVRQRVSRGLQTMRVTLENTQ